ncbi:MAG: helix-turn-helix transcriptional regulator [Pseudomonadota bacterium]
MTTSRESFPDVLTLFMRRIRASAAGVATEIGLSREAVNNWRNGVSSPSARSRDKVLACARYLRLTEAETNRLLAAADFAPEYPLQTEQTGATPFSTPFSDFMDGLFMQLAQATPYPISLLLSQAHWGQPPFREALLRRARAQYGDASVLHIQPPYSVTADSSEYFAAIARQCGFADVSSDYEFEAALEKKLVSGARLFCLVSRFEQGTPALRETLAGILRSLSEMHSGRLHLLLCGGEALADLKYRNGDLSLLNIAQVNHWPELTVQDMAILAQQRWPEQAWPVPLLTQLLTLCGGHPALFEEGMQWLAKHGLGEGGDHSALRAQLASSARLWQTFLPLAQDSTAQARLGEHLRADDLGRARPYLQDEHLRRLFWGNLIHVRGHGDQARLHWRCDTIREAGRMALESCSSS